jgi:hypothetical protein
MVHHVNAQLELLDQFTDLARVLFAMAVARDWVSAAR